MNADVSAVLADLAAKMGQVVETPACVISAQERSQCARRSYDLPRRQAPRRPHLGGPGILSQLFGDAMPKGPITSHDASEMKPLALGSDEAQA